MNDLDRILGEQEVVEPSPDFALRVMTAVRERSHATAWPRSWMMMCIGLFLALVGGPLLVLVIEGAQSLDATTSESSFGLLWILGLLVATSVGAVLPMQLLES